MALFGTKSLNYNVGDRTLPKSKSARYFPHHLPGEPTLTQMDFELLSEEAKNGKYDLLLEKAMNFALGLEYVNADYDYSNFTAPDLMSNPDINQVGTTTDEAMSFLANMAKKHIDNQSKVYFEHLPYLAKFEEKLSIELNPDQRKFFMLILRVGMGLSLIENNSGLNINGLCHPSISNVLHTPRQVLENLANKEVKVEFDAVRTKGKFLRPKSLMKFLPLLIFGFSLSISAPAQAAPSTTPTCTAGAGLGAIAGVSTNQAGHGCVVIKYNNGSADVYETFNYTGTDQSWTSPASTTTLTFYLVGAGGGAMNAASRGPGASGGFATGTYSATGSTVFKIIVGQGGNGTDHTAYTYGGGGKADYGSGGGRSAIRLSNATEDLITAGGGGGGGYDARCGGGGGGTTGQDAVVRSTNGEHGKGATQTAGGGGGYSINSNGTGGTGIKYQGGLGRDDSGGGGGGYWGGGGGGDNAGGGGGSGYLHPTLITSGALVQGTCTATGSSSVFSFTITYDGNGNTSGTSPANATINAFTSPTLATNSGTLARTGYTFAGWNTRANGTGTSYTVGQTGFYPTADRTLYAQWNSTITYNGNGQTSASNTVPSATTALGTAGNTTLATQGTLAKTGATFSGWNTAADGTGTRYAAGLTTYASTGSITLYAQWTLPTGTPTLSSSSDLGTSNSDKLTKDNTPDINVGTLVSGASVTLTATPASGSAVTCTFTASSTSGTCTFPTLADGIYSITATQTYNGATSAVSTALANVQIDTVRPTVTLTSSAIVSGGNSLATPAALSNNYNITATFSEVVNGFVIGEITKNAESTGWAISTTALSTSALAAYTFNVINSTGAGNVPGKLYLSIAAGVASDAAGNTNVATTSDFIINTVIQLTLTNQYQAGIIPVVGGNNATVVQTSNGASLDLTGQGGVTRANHTFAGWSLVTTNGSGAVIPSPYTPTVPLFLYSSWTPNVFVVTYDANGGNGAPATTSQSFNYGGTALSPSARGTLARTGYTFGGWSTTAVASGTIYSNTSDAIASTTTSYTPTASITLYAKWTAGTYTVSFNGNSFTGGSTASLSITAGTAKALTANGFTRTGYTFAGWNTAADGSGTSYADAASVTLYADTTLYAKWTVVKPGAPTVSAATAGNTTATVTVTGAAASGTTIGPATSYSIQTYASDGTTVITGKTCTVLDSASPKSCQITGLTNSTIYKFLATAINTTGSTAGSISTVTATPAPYVVTYSLNGGTLTAPDTSPVNYNLGTPLTLPLPSKTGYTFTGWNNPSSASVGLNGASYSPSATITLTAQWSALTYSVTYSGNGSNGGTVPSVGSFTYGNSYSIAEDGTMTKSGYTFAGWTTAANGTGTLYANAADSITSSTATYSGAANLTLYAKWTAQVYAITYDVNGATGSASKSSDTFTFGGTGLALPTIESMAKSGYTFGGWSETSSGSAVSSPYSPTQSRTLYAVWSGVPYSITYNVNGGTGSLSDVIYTTGTAGVTLNNGASLSRTGYTFGGWKDSAGDTKSSPFTTNANITLNAIWTAKTVSITYAKGVATTTTNFPDNATSSYGANFALSSTIDTTTAVGSDNYAFAGWYETSTATTYKPGDSFRITTEANLTFTAQWIRLYEVTYNANGGVFAGGDGVNDSECPSKLCATGQTITLNATPTRSGFTFNGWSNQGGTLVTDSNPATVGIQTAVTDSNYIFYATWTANSYTINFAAGAGSNGSASAITDSHGAIVQLPASTGYSLSGSVFTGWLIGSTTYAAGAFYTMGTDASPITATAQYANNTFKVFYNTNGGSSTPAATSAVSGASITLDAATSFTKEGYDFDGWSDGTHSPFAASYATTMGAANSTLIAQWKIKSPAAPTFSSVTGVDGGATVVVAPGSGGGSPTSYTVTSTPSGGSCTIYAPATSCSIAPLTNGTAYTFTVSATNSTGTTNGATSSSVTPAGKPGAPTGVSAVRGNGQATVTFTAPIDTGGSAITSYTVTAYDSSGNAAGTCTGSGTTYTCTGLTNGSAYTFKATATNALSTSDLSTASSAVTPATVPGAPTSLAASSSSSGSATITFSAPSSNGGSSITGYTITSSPAGATCTVGGNATTYTCTGLTDGTAYTFTAVATNEVGNSIASTANSPALTTQGAASAPSTISATAGDSQATVTFSGAVANGATITSYTVQAYDSSGSAVSGATCTATTSATNGSCIVTGLTNGSSYTFKAITNSTANSSATSSTSSSASTAVIPAKVPDAPTSIAVTAGTGKVTVTWDEPSSNGSAILSYTVRAYDAAGNAVSGATCTATAPSTTCDVSSNLVAGTNYTFKVTATSAVGTSSASSASSATSINAAPSAPPNVTAVASNASATASWDAPVNINGSAVTGYTATAYDSSNNARGTCTTGASTLTCTVTGLTNGSPYTFKVTATNGIGTSSQSTASSAVTPSTVPNPPTNVTAAAGDAAATISFSAPTNTGGSDILSYTVTSSPGAATCTVNAPTRSCTLAGLINGTAYTFTVIATNANGNSVASSASASVTPLQSSAPTLASLTNQPLGDPYVGSTLTSNMSFNGSPTPTITYQWKVCESETDLASCTNLAGATSSTYVPTISELGKYIAVTATAANGISPNASETSVPTLVINPEIIFTAPTGTQTGTVGTALVISLSGAGGVGTLTYTVSSGSLPAGVTLDPATGQIAGTPTTAGTYTFTVRATDSNGVYKEVVVTITVAAATTPSSSGGGGGTPAPSVDPTPQTVTCDSSCQAAKDAAATKAAADKAAAEAIAKAAADKAAAEAAAAEAIAKAAADKAAAEAAAAEAIAKAAADKAAAEAAAAAAAAKAAIDKAAAAAVAQAAADAAAKAAAAQAKAAADAQAAATKAAADAAAALKNSTTTAAAKAAATKSANDAAAAATAAVKAAATAAKEAANAKTSATNANKQVDIAINSLTSKTAASQASAQANAIAAVAKTAANEAAAAAATRAAEAKAVATAAQKAAADTAARIAIEQKQAADAAALAKIVADAAAKATAEKVAAIAAATKATEDLAKVLADKAVLADQAAKETDQAARAAIQKKIDEVSTKAEEVQKTVESATTKADAAVAAQVSAVQAAEVAVKEAQTQATEAIDVKIESVVKTTEATKAVAAATVATKVAEAAKAAAAKVPAKATIIPKANTSTSKNSATATVTGLKPGQKVKVTVNVKDK